MKRIISLLLAVIIVLPVMFACGKSKTPDAIIILPGIMGSELFLTEDATYGSKDYKSGTKLWLGTDTVKNILAVPDYIELLAPEVGCSVSPAEPIVNEVNDELTYGSLDTYKKLYYAIYGEYKSVCDVIFYSYDWRYDPYDCARELDTYITESGYKNIVIVAHSMGGLVASHYMAIGDKQRDKIHTYVSVGVPYLGADQASYAMITGNINTLLANLLVSNEARKVCPAFDSMYALLPYEQFWTPSLSIYSLTNKSQVSGYAETMDTYAKYISNYSRDKHIAANEHNELLFTKKGEHITELVNSYYIIGNGEKTIVGVSLPESRLLSSVICTPDKSGTGDGTVAFYSATIAGTLPKNRVFVKSGTKERSATHGGLVDGSDETSISFILNILNGSVDLLSAEDLNSLYSIRKGYEVVKH